MTDALVRGRAVRWVYDDFPGVIDVCVVDADGREHHIVEKVPVLTERVMTAESASPVELWLDADTGDVDDERVQVTFAHGVETTEGCSRVQMRTVDVAWL